MKKALILLALPILIILTSVLVSAYYVQDYNHPYPQNHRLAYKTITYDYNDRDVFVQVYDPYYYNRYNYIGPEIYYRPVYVPYYKPYINSYYNKYPYDDRVRSIKFYSPYENKKYRYAERYPRIHYSYW